MIELKWSQIRGNQNNRISFITKSNIASDSLVVTDKGYNSAKYRAALEEKT
jgi:hypothetical protein